MGPQKPIDRFLVRLAQRGRVILIGGLAVIAHGFSRATKDGDVWLEPCDSSEQWSQLLISVLTEFAGLKLAAPPGWRIIVPNALAVVIEDVGMIRIQGLDCPLDVFRKPNELETNDFDAVWARATPTEQGLRLPDPVDLILTKLETGRDQDRDDIQFLTRKVQADMGGRLETATPAEADTLLAKYSDSVVLRRALLNPHEAVRQIALSQLHRFAEDGDPFAIDILKEQEGEE